MTCEAFGGVKGTPFFGVYRTGKALGTMIKVPEMQFHHEVTNQYRWNQFQVRC